MKAQRRRRNGRSGSAIVESSLIFLGFFVMLLGILDFGQFLFIHQALVERGRSAARWGAINDPANSSAITNMVLYNQVINPTGDNSSTFQEPGYLNLTRSNIAVSNPGNGTDDARLVLTISGYRYSVISPYISGSYVGPPVTVSVPLGIYN